MIRKVGLSKRAEKSLGELPKYIAFQFFAWKRLIQEEGLENVRRISGFHDEPLRGKLKGLVRSVRLSRGYRIFYRTDNNLIFVEEINRHDYKEIARLFRV